MTEKYFSVLLLMLVEENKDSMNCLRMRFTAKLMCLLLFHMMPLDRIRSNESVILSSFCCIFIINLTMKIFLLVLS